MNNPNNVLKEIPSINIILQSPEIATVIKNFGIELVTYTVQQTVNTIKTGLLGEDAEKMIQSLTDFLDLPLNRIQKSEFQQYIVFRCMEMLHSITASSLKPVMNGSGIILHTNLGRAPYGAPLVEEVSKILKGYTNLEFDLFTGKRGERNQHAVELLKYLTGAEDAVVVNNNAAAVLFILMTFSQGKEAIVSRGELIEIGGSFRIPEIMALSGTQMIEVGATNKTRVADYEKRITPNTALLFKAHRSNFSIVGFTEEVSINELAELGKQHQIISAYDIGSGLLRRVDRPEIQDEPIVSDAINAGIDLVCFSGDKLLGGGQAGIIVGKKRYISMLKKHPFFRALRVDKTTLAILQAACRNYLNDDLLFRNNILFRTLRLSQETLHERACHLKAALQEQHINAEIIPTKGQYGGGTMPNKFIDSFAVELLPNDLTTNESIGEVLYHRLLLCPTPLLTNLVKGKINIDMLCIEEEDIPHIADVIAATYRLILKD